MKRSVIILIILLFLALFIALAQTRLSQPIVSTLAPIQRASTKLTNFLRNSLQKITTLRSLQLENQRLRQQVAQLKRHNARLTEYYLQNERLKKLINFKSHTPQQVTPAEVIGKSPSNWLQTITIDKGKSQGIKLNDVIVCHQGLIGSVFEVHKSTANVLLITDRNSGVGAMVQRTRYLGVIKGTGGKYCKMLYLPQIADIKKDDLIITSGISSFFPKGIVIGKVTAIKSDDYTSSKYATVKPSVDFNRLEEVLIIPAETNQR